MPKWMPSNPDYFIREYEGGRSMQSIADEYGVPLYSVHTALHFLSAKVRKDYSSRIMPPRVHVDEMLLVSMYESGMSINALAKHFNVARTAIIPRLNRLGVILRSRSDQEHIKWDRMTSEQRQNQYSQAHNAARGRVVTTATKTKHALTVQKKRLHISDTEHALREMLHARGIDSTPQKAVGPYNIDLAVPPVAIEIWGGRWHWSGRHHARCEQRLRYLMENGWHVLILPIIPPRWLLEDSVVDFVVAQIQDMAPKSDPLREYKVIWGAGAMVFSGRSNDTLLTIGPPNPL